MNFPLNTPTSCRILVIIHENIVLMIIKLTTFFSSVPCFKWPYYVSLRNNMFLLHAYCMFHMH